MIRQVVQSSNLKSVGYDPAGQLLEIEFQSGGVYQYQGVPETVYTGLMAASSLGAYFHEHIRNKYPYRKV